MRTVPLSRGTSQLGGASLQIDSSEYDAMIHDIEHKLPSIIAKALSKVLSEAQFETRAYIEQKGRSGHVPSAAERVAELFERKDVFVKGNQILSGMAALRALASPDDDGNQFDFSLALQEGMRAQNVLFRSPGAAEKGRQFGRRGSKTPWTQKNPGSYYHFGFPTLRYIEYAIGIVERRIEKRIGNAIEREFGPGSYYGR